MNIKLLKAQSILQEALQEALFDLEDNRIKNIAVTRVECTQGKELARVFLDKNSSLGAPCGDFGNLGRFADAPVQSHAPNSQKTPQFPPQILELDSNKSDSTESKNDESTKQTQKTIEGIAVEVAEFLPNFECETRLGVCDHSKFGKSPQDAPKSELQNTINILLEPSLAFGTGHHSSTFMCIEAIQALDSHDSLKNKKLLDFGCGSGILALCANKLGAVVDLCDIDESAIVESKKNFNNNNATISHIWQGGIADRFAKKGAKSGIYDIIVANIIASVLIEQKDNIDSSLKCGGIAVLSGILDIYKDEVLARFSDFVPLAIRRKDEWICAILQKNKTLHKN